MTVQTAREKPQFLSANGRSTALHLLAIFAIVLLCCWPLLRYGIPDLSHDGIIHAGWQNNFSKQLWSGDLYPRWLSDVNDGLGSPTFFFYPAIPSYAASIFRPILASRDPDGWLQAGYGCVLAMLLSGVAAYFWLCALASPAAALFGAIVYILAPYHLAIDLYTRGAVSELWAFLWLPLILLSAESMARKSKFAFPGLAVSYALLVMTHLPTTVCFSPILLAYGWLFVEPRNKPRGLVQVVGAMALGTGLASVYLLPTMLDQAKARMYLVNSFYGYRKNLLITDFTWHANLLMRMLLVNLATLFLVGAFLWICLRFQDDSRRRSLAIFYAAVSIFGFFFMTWLSDPFWRFVPFLKDVEFPWRFSTLIVLAVAALSALCFPVLFERRGRWVLACTALTMLAWIGAATFTASRVFSDAQTRHQFHSTDNEALIRYLADPCEFWPSSAAVGTACMESVSMRVPILENLIENHPAKSALFRGVTGRPGASLSVADWRPRKIVLSVDAPEPGRLTLIHFFYPGWSGRIEGASTDISAFPSKPDGFLQMEVPQGKYKLTIALARQLPERLGIAISLVCVAVTLLLLVYCYFSNPIGVDNSFNGPQAGHFSHPAEVREGTEG